jgi:nucleotide-binding universal stress UspA family protein
MALLTGTLVLVPAAEGRRLIMIALNHILVPTDFSDTSAAAVKYGVALARAFNARLILFHAVPRTDFEMIVEAEQVVERTLSETAASPFAPSFNEIVQNAAREKLGTSLTSQEQQELQAEYVLRSSGRGGPSVEILRYAKECDIDLIVMGTHGLGFVGHLLMGSVAEKVVRKAPCPVLTVRHPEHEFVLPDDPGQPATKKNLLRTTSICVEQQSSGEVSYSEACAGQAVLDASSNRHSRR